MELLIPSTVSEKLDFDNLQGEKEYGRVGHQVGRRQLGRLPACLHTHLF